MNMTQTQGFAHTRTSWNVFFTQCFQEYVPSPLLVERVRHSLGSDEEDRPGCDEYDVDTRLCAHTHFMERFSYPMLSAMNMT